MKTKLTIIALMLSTVVGMNAYANQQGKKCQKKTEVESATLHFRFQKSDIDKSFDNNDAALQQMQDMLTDALVNPNATVDSIVINGVSSPEGNYSVNEQLARRRARNLQGMLADLYPELSPATFRTSYEVTTWKAMERNIQADSKVPAQKEVLNAINGEGDRMQIENRLKGINNGKSFNYLVANVLPAARKADFKLYQSVREELPPLVVEETVVETEEPIEQEVVLTEERVSTSKKHPAYMAIKTNLAAWAFVAPNLGVEFGFGRRFSIDIPVYYKWFDVYDVMKLQGFMVQPEFRVWISEPMRGHFFGVYGTLGNFDVAGPGIKHLDRAYKSTDLTWGVGISYGYAANFNKHWGMEFTVGAGYMNVDYKRIERSTGEEMYRGHKNYFGFSKAAATLIYRFNLRK